jgi:hypothetical protein
MPPRPTQIDRLARQVIRAAQSLGATVGAVTERRTMSGKDLLFWIATMVAFPLAGLAARGVAGPVDSVATAFLAGAISGSVLGVAQWLALRRIGADVRWIIATAVGLSVGLGLAYVLFEYGDSIADLALVGALSGLGIGIAQWWVLRELVEGSLVWIPATAVAWALGWTVATAIGVDPDDRWANFGLSGAVTATLLLAAVLWFLTRSATREPATS